MLDALGNWCPLASFSFSPSPWVQVCVLILGLSLQILCPLLRGLLVFFAVVVLLEFLSCQSRTPCLLNFTLLPSCLGAVVSLPLVFSSGLALSEGSQASYPPSRLGPCQLL